MDAGGWEILFDDAIGPIRERLIALYPSFSVADREDLKRDQNFINALWGAKDELSDLVEELFDDYELKSSENTEFLKAVEDTLDELGIPYKKCGRKFIHDATSADLIIIDLFLGMQQGAPEYEVTVKGLKEAVKDRSSTPPSIVLMSRIPNVSDYSKDFRRDVGLHASTCKYIKKENIKQAGHLDSLIIKLAKHRADSHVLASFLETWKRQAKHSVDVAASELLRIDIDDLQYIKTLMREEGVTTSSYMLDVFERVLQYEIEDENEVMLAAAKIDAVDERPAPLAIAADKDSSRILQRLQYVNPVRIQRNTGAEWPVTFGDIIAPAKDKPVSKQGIFSGDIDRVFFVASPECDLVRPNKLQSALLISGTRRPISWKDGMLSTDTLTPIFSPDGENQFQIRWNFGEHLSVSLRQLRNLLKEGGKANVVARMRDVSALSLRQRFINNLSRVAEVAPPLKQHPVKIALYYPAGEGDITELQLTDGNSIDGMWLQNRKGDKATLIIDQAYELPIVAALRDIDESTVKSQSRGCIKQAKEQNFMEQIYSLGLKEGSFRSDKGFISAELPTVEQMEAKPEYKKVGTVVMQEDIAETLGRKLAGAGLIFHVQPREA